MTDTLARLAQKSVAPVFIEATGMANSVKLVERLVVENVFATYRLAGAWFVLDATEATDDNFAEILPEIKLADAVFVGKTDLVSAEILTQIEQKLRDEGVENVHEIARGKVENFVVGRESAALEKLADLDGSSVKIRDFNYTVVAADEEISESALEKSWPLLRAKYGLRRAKGNFATKNGSVHVEATPAQILFSEVQPDDDLRKLVFIGENANKITRAKLLDEIALFAETEIAVDKLLEMYDEYKVTNERKNALTSSLAKARIRHENDEKIARELENETKKLNKISDEMTFATPLV